MLWCVAVVVDVLAVVVAVVVVVAAAVVVVVVAVVIVCLAVVVYVLVGFFLRGLHSHGPCGQVHVTVHPAGATHHN